MLKSRPSKLEEKNSYERWVESQGVPVIRDFFIPDLRKVKVEPWERLGGNGAFLNLSGADELSDAFICEIPSGKSLKPQRHLFEAMFFVIGGRGATSVWNDDGAKQTFEWQTGSLFAAPLNVSYQHFNGSGSEPARLLGVTNAPLMMDLFHNLDFVFKNPFRFDDRFNGEEGYFSGGGVSLPHRIWDTNFVADVRTHPLQERAERGKGNRKISLELAENTMAAHVSEFPVASYKKAHRHGPGAHVIILSGKGYSLMWPQDSDIQRFDWQEWSMIVPPNMWFHQHFNTGTTPARYLAMRWGSTKYKFMWSTQGAKVDQDVKSGGDQIEFEDEDPMIRKTFEAELDKETAKVGMREMALAEGR